MTQPVRKFISFNHSTLNDCRCYILSNPTNTHCRVW